VTNFSLPYGETQLSFQIPSTIKVDFLTPAASEPISHPLEAIYTALLNPVACKKLEFYKDATSIGIAINDKTRPVPQPNPLYPLLDHLDALGVDREKISLFVGSGTHTPMTASELPRIVDEAVIQNYRIVVHDCDQSPMVDLGQTAFQTPIQINADFYSCDVKISVGNIEPHHFMGFSGGVKTAVIGLASRETINLNHAMLSHQQAKSGTYHLNPMRQDIEEMGRKAGIYYSLGTVLDEDKRIIQIFFGNPATVMKKAIPFIRQTFGVSVPSQYDLVIASPGGAPKDINLYQAEKGLTHAARITRNGGWVILLAACPEGSGSRSYEKFVKSMKSHQAIIKQFRGGFFEVGPHKAFQIAREAVRVNTILVSEIPPATVKQWKLTPSTPQLLQSLINWLIEQLPPNPRVALLPASTRTMTEVKQL